jgi:threonine dehydratase
VGFPRAVDFRAACGTVASALDATPLFRAPGLGDEASIKVETVQPTGSFKVRGALVALSRADERSRIITSSTGNHALAVAFAAELTGREATVVVPRNAPVAKLEALRKSAAEVIEFGETYAEAEEHARQLANDRYEYLSPYDHPGVLAGNGTLAFELAAQREGRLTIVCPVGAGGLAAGLGLAARELEQITIVGVEAEASKAVSTAVRVGRVVPVEVGPTLADGLAGNLAADARTVEVIRRHVTALVAVSEEEIKRAIRYLLSEHGLLAEGAGAASVAAVLAGKVHPRGHLVAIVSGRNIALGALADVLLEDTAA